MPYQYALSLYRSDVVGGESDPNSVAPTHTVQASGTGGEAQSALLYCIDGTSLAVTPWFKDSLSGVWLPLLGGVVTSGTPVIIDVPPGALLAFQLGTNTGGVTKFGVGFIAGDFELPVGGGATESVAEQFAPVYEDNTAGRALVEARNTLTPVSAGTTLVKTGAGFLHLIAITTPIAAGTLKAYDALTATGTPIVDVTLPATIASDVDDILLDGTFSTGLTVVLAGTGIKATVSSR